MDHKLDGYRMISKLDLKHPFALLVFIFLVFIFLVHFGVITCQKLTFSYRIDKILNGKNKVHPNFSFCHVLNIQ